jgi:hypothetical protein
VRDAFADKGHNAWSCDLLLSEKPGQHYQGDVRDMLTAHDWDLMIAHPPCTYLTCAAEWCYNDIQTKKLDPDKLYGAKRREAREKALEFVMLLANAPVPRIAI